MMWMRVFRQARGWVIVAMGSGAGTARHHPDGIIERTRTDDLTVLHVEVFLQQEFEK
jgi:hypothetical protein